MRTSPLIVGILTLASTSCAFRHKTPPRVFIPPQPRPAAAVQAKIGPLPDAPPIPADPAQLQPPQLPDLVVENLPEMPEAAKHTVHRAAPSLPPKPVTPEPVVPEPAPPRLAQMITPEQFRENTKTLDDSLANVNRILTIVDGKNLTTAQKETAERIRTFKKQAEQAREQDLLTAVSLARRADLLAKDLLERLP